jgi:hypothetical protein
MAEENHVVQILELKHGQDILNMRFKIDVAMREMHAFAETGVCRSKHFVPLSRHERPHLLPRPARLPTAMRYKENGHRSHLQPQP